MRFNDYRDAFAVQKLLIIALTTQALPDHCCCVS